MSESELPEGEMTEAEMKNELDLLKEINDLKPPKLKTLISKLKYMGNQYSAGQVAARLVMQVIQELSNTHGVRETSGGKAK